MHSLNRPSPAAHPRPARLTCGPAGSHTRSWRRCAPVAERRPPAAAGGSGPLDVGVEADAGPAVAPRLGQEVEPAVPQVPPPQEASGAGPAPAVQHDLEQPARFSLYNWLRFAGLPVRAAGAAPAAPPPPQAAAALPQTDEQLVSQLFGDGMAAGLRSAPGAPSPSSGRGIRLWHSQPPQPAAEDPLGVPAGGQLLDASHPTLQLLRSRLADGSRPGARRDGFKLGLVVEGGGMRGCVTGGGLQALSDLGMRDAFDAVYGSSAGAINSTYFLSGQREGVHIYHDHIAHSEFIDIKRLWQRSEAGTPVLNLAYLIDYVMRRVQPLDWDAVVASDIPLKVVASSLDSLQPVLLEGFACDQDLAACLRASACVPEIAGGPVQHRGHRLVDAACFESVPFRSAIADGCTHVLALCSRPKRTVRGRLMPPLESALEAAIKRTILSPGYMVPVWKAESESLAKDGLSEDEMLLRSFDDDAHELPWFAGAHVLPIYPGPGAVFSPLCTDVPTLKGGVAEGKRAVMRMARALLLPEEERAKRGVGAEEAHALESNIMPFPPGELLVAGEAARAGGCSGARGRLARLWGG